MTSAEWQSWWDRLWAVIRAATAVIALIAFGFLVRDMLDNVADDPLVWARRMAIFGSVEAIVFAAAGFLFGREVNRQRAENAEESAESAQEARS
jgi:hypothetical protein